MMPHVPCLLPEEDILDDEDDADAADPTVPGDLWYRLTGNGAVSNRSQPRNSR